MAKMLDGKHALVTGGGSGIGLAIATALAGERAAVTITGRRLQVLEAAAQKVKGLHPMAMDVTDEDSVVTTIADAVKARGPLSICVANAGIAEGRALHQSDMAFWRKIMATNLDGAFLTIREAMKSMHGTDWGRVIAISSIAGIKGLRGASAYTASKHGVIGLIRGLSEDYIGGPITFNALCPGYVDTPIIDQNVAAISARAGMSQDDAMKVMVNANRHKRLIDASEVAAAALWLCSDKSGSVNAQTIEIFGGKA